MRFGFRLGTALALKARRTNRKWSPNRELNPRPLPYQGSALPLSYLGQISGMSTRRPAGFLNLRGRAGAGYRTRTDNSHFGRVVLYQLS